MGKITQQFSNYNILSKEKADSVTISIIDFRDKTTELAIIYKKDSISGLEYPVYDKKDTLVVLKKKKISYEILALNKILIDKNSYVGDVPLMPQYDIQIDYYKYNSIIQTITISSYTKKIVIKKKGCKNFINEEGQEIDPCFFIGKISKKLKAHIAGLLKKKKLWNKEQKFFEDL